MSDEPWDDPSAKRWVKHVLEDMAPKMADSAMVMQLVPSGEHSEGDVKFWVELGASIMMDKPILAIAMMGQELPPKLLAVADEVIYLEDGVNPEASEELAAAMTRMLGEDK